MHETIAVILCTYQDCIANQGKNLMRDLFYNGLLPSLQDALGFTMVDLPEQEQVNTSFGIP